MGDFTGKTDIAARKWLGCVLGIKWEKIKDESISFDYDDLGHGCDTCGYGGGIRYYIRYTQGGKIKRHLYSYYNLGTILKEIMEFQERELK